MTLIVFTIESGVIEIVFIFSFTKCFYFSRAKDGIIRLLYFKMGPKALHGQRFQEALEVAVYGWTKASFDVEKPDI